MLDWKPLFGSMKGCRGPSPGTADFLRRSLDEADEASVPVVLARHRCPRSSLGPTPLANALITAENLGSSEERFPLFWRSAKCTLAQITESVPPESSFSEYLYFSSFSDTMVALTRSRSPRVVLGRGLGPSSWSWRSRANDGYLLQFYKRAGVPVLGVEPAATSRGWPRASGHPDAVRVLRPRSRRTPGRRGQARRRAPRQQRARARAPTSTASSRGVASCSSADGVAVDRSCPTCATWSTGSSSTRSYHEHLCYFSLTALDRLFARHGLGVRCRAAR